MQRSVCTHAQDSAKCCFASLLELTNRDIETLGELKHVLAQRGLSALAVAIEGAITPETLRPYREFGFWLLTGPTDGGEATSVMLGDLFYHTPQPCTYKLDSPGPWTLTFLVAYNPMFVRAHTKPTA